MYELGNILTEFEGFVEKSAAMMMTTPPPAGGTAQDSSGTVGSAATAGQPTARVNETNTTSTQQAPPIAMPTHKAPTSNAPGKQQKFDTFNK